MNKTFSALLCACLLLFAPVMALAHTATATDEGESRYKALRLTPEVYANASADLSDLRLTNATGEAVPYFIRSGGVVESTTVSTLTLSALPPVMEKDMVLFDFMPITGVAIDVPDGLGDAPLQPTTPTDGEKTADAPADDFGETALRLTPSTDAPFAGTVRVLGSRDGKHWNDVCSDTIYRVDGNERLEIAFPAPQRYGYYRLVAASSMKDVAFSSAALASSSSRSETVLLTETHTPAFTVAQDGQNTLVTLTGLKNLKLLSLTLEASGMFQRMVSAPTGSKELYQLTFSDVSYRDVTLPLSGVWTEDALVITIANGDDKPLDITGLSVSYAADELVFEGTQGPYTLTFGTPQEAPRYDIESYRAQVLRERIDRVALSAVTLDAPAPEPPSAFDWQLVFNVVVIAVALLLGFVLLARIRKSEG